MPAEETVELGGAGKSASGESVKLILAALVVLAAATVLILFFRWLIRQQNGRRSGGAFEETRVDCAPETPPKRRKSSSAVQRVRGQYRSFMKLCIRQGIALNGTDTSTEIGEKAAEELRDIEALDELRLIYQRARYHGEAGKADAARAKALLRELKGRAEAEK